MLIRILCVIFSLSLLACEKPPFPEGKIIDLTHPFNSETIYWPTEDGFLLKEVFKGKKAQGFFYTANEYRAAEHGGTHVDAPIHFAAGKRSVGEIPVTQLIGPAVVIDVSKQALKNPDYQIYTEDLLEWEKYHGQIPPGSILLLKTGYGRYWPERKKYLGTNLKGPQAVAALHFPGLHSSAAGWLVKARNIKAIGIDTPSIDYGQSKNFRSHQTLAAENIPILENIAKLEQIPSQGATLIALPMKISGGSGAPTRIIAILPKAK